MKKLILKTALITLGVVLILALSLFGIVSFCSPVSMMNFFNSLGLESIGGDYAEQEYRNSGDLRYLAHAFEVAAEAKKYELANKRFSMLYGETPEGRQAFYDLCNEIDKEDLPATLPGGSALPPEVLAIGYRSAICGRAAQVKYYIADTPEEQEDVINFAVSETGEEFTLECPFVQLSAAALGQNDSVFCARLRERLLSESKFNRENEFYKNIESLLEEQK